MNTVRINSLIHMQGRYIKIPSAPVTYNKEHLLLSKSHQIQNQWKKQKRGKVAPL